MDTYVIIYLWIQKEGDCVSPRTGRPTDEPKILSTRIRLSNDDIERLEFCCEKTGLKKSEIIRQGIKEVYKKLNI
mgnify:CR=1 FL=1